MDSLALGWNSESPVTNSKACEGSEQHRVRVYTGSTLAILICDSDFLVFNRKFHKGHFTEPAEKSIEGKRWQDSASHRLGLAQGFVDDCAVYASQLMTPKGWIFNFLCTASWQKKCNNVTPSFPNCFVFTASSFLHFWSHKYLNPDSIF